MVFSAISLKQIATGCNLVICLLKKNNVAGCLCCFAVSSTTTPISVENV